MYLKPIVGAIRSWKNNFQLKLTAAPGSPLSPFLPFLPRLPWGPGGPKNKNKNVALYGWTGE